MPDLDLDRVTRETTEFLQRLIQFDTTNPPGNELPCCQWIAEVFRAEGIASTIVEPQPGRGSIVARLPGRGAAKPLLLLAHLDVVPAVAADWEHAPFGGELIDGEVWGRGALDMKGLAAIWMALFLEIKRSGLVLERDIIFAACADEEMGGTWGAKWLVDNRPDLVDCEYVLNEGGGTGWNLAGKTIYTYQTAEKGICWTRVTAEGTAGHASVPHDDNPVVHLAEALARIGRSHLPLHRCDSFRTFVERLAAILPGDLARAMPLLLDENGSETVLGALPEKHMADQLRAMSRNTASPTCLKASDKVNVIPQTATAEVDCRIIPGQTPEDVLRELRELLGLEGRAGEKLHLELTRTSVGTESPVDTPLSRAIQKAMGKHASDAGVVPYLVTGGTDSRFFRPRGIVSYGFHPTLPRENIRTVHGKNERISVESLRFGLAVLWDVMLEIAG